MDKTDETLMVDYQLGSEEAFRVLYSRHAGRVYGFLKSRIKEEALVKDIYQSTFLKLHHSRSKYQPTYPFLPWLFMLCRNELIDAIRKKKRSKEDAFEILPEYFIPEPESAGGPTPSFDLLTGPQKKAMELRYGSDFSFEAIATELNTSPANARKIVSRAVKFLRGHYEKK